MREATARLNTLHATLTRLKQKMSHVRMDSFDHYREAVELIMPCVNGGTMSALREAAQLLEKPEPREPKKPYSVCCHGPVGYLGDEIKEPGFAEAFEAGLSYYCVKCGKPCQTYSYLR